MEENKNDENSKNNTDEVGEDDHAHSTIVGKPSAQDAANPIVVIDEIKENEGACISRNYSKPKTNSNYRRNATRKR
jgi:hypothetical protein